MGQMGLLGLLGQMGLLGPLGLLGQMGPLGLLGRLGQLGRLGLRRLRERNWRELLLFSWWLCGLTWGLPLR